MMSETDTEEGGRWEGEECRWRSSPKLSVNTHGNVNVLWWIAYSLTCMGEVLSYSPGALWEMCAAESSWVTTACHHSTETSLVRDWLQNTIFRDWPVLPALTPGDDASEIPWRDALMMMIVKWKSVKFNQNFLWPTWCVGLLITQIIVTLLGLISGSQRWWSVHFQVRLVVRWDDVGGPERSELQCEWLDYWNPCVAQRRKPGIANCH